MIDRKSTRLNSSHTVIYTLSLHDALPILKFSSRKSTGCKSEVNLGLLMRECASKVSGVGGGHDRSEEHTSELQSHSDLHSFPTRRSSDLKILVTQVYRLQIRGESGPPHERMRFQGVRGWGRP